MFLAILFKKKKTYDIAAVSLRFFIACVKSDINRFKNSNVAPAGKETKNIKKIIFLLAYNSLLTDLEYIHTNNYFLYI
jgi:hypothetical protein